MTLLSRYLLGLAAVATVLFTDYEAFSYWVPLATTQEAGTPQWKVERLAHHPATAENSAASLSPIYPATPGKELLGKTVITAIRAPQRHRHTVVGKLMEKPVRHALAFTQLPRNFFMTSRPDTYSQQRMSYASEPQTELPMLTNFEHSLY
jgi:hypothetical protein